jgi:hypothetical protein
MRNIKGMKYLLKTLLAAAAILMAPVLFAQPGKPPAKVIPVQKFKPPKVKTTLGRCTDSMVITKEEAKQLVSLPLKISDAKNSTYKLSSYQFMYTRVAVTEDEASGKVLPTTTTVSDYFKTSPLPELWQENMKLTVTSGEIFHFFDVIVRDAQGRLFFAPDLKIFIR